MNRPVDKNNVNQGDMLAKKVSTVWMVFLLLVIMGFAMPLLRVWLGCGGVGFDSAQPPHSLNHHNPLSQQKAFPERSRRACQYTAPNFKHVSGVF
jgi:hypothetical protein